MSLDTASRQYSALNISAPWRGPSIFPEATVDVPTRLALLGFCSEYAINVYSIEATSGSFAWTGNSVELTPTTLINTDAEKYSLINPMCPWRGLATFPGTIDISRRLSLLGLYSDFSYGFTYTMVALPGAFVWEGEPSFSDFEISGIAGSFAMSGSDAALIATRTLYAASGVFEMSGEDANLNYFIGRTLIGVTGTFVMTGADAVFDRPRAITAETGSFVMEGYESIFTWYDTNGVEIPLPSRDKGAGSKKRRRHHVEIDGEEFPVNSEEEAIYILEKTKEEAEATAKLAIERAQRAQKRPVRKVMQDARKALEIPNIEVSDDLSEPASVILSEIDDLYRDTLRTIEIAALLRKREEEDEEAILLMLL